MKQEIIIEYSTALDHLSGEEVGMAIAALANDQYVLDAIYLQGIGKKNRPAGLLQVLCKPDHADEVLAAIFRHTHTLGVRKKEVERYILDRSHELMDVCGEQLDAKGYILENNHYVRPEADAVRRLAKKLNTGAPGVRFARKLP